jgi:transcriptional regulator with XRE-family HTH domain
MLGQKLKKRREELNMSIEELAGKTDLDYYHLRRVEAGKTKRMYFETCYKLSKALDVPLTFFD